MGSTGHATAFAQMHRAICQQIAVCLVLIRGVANFTTCRDDTSIGVHYIIVYSMPNSLIT